MASEIDHLLEAFASACLEVFGVERVVGVIAHGSAVKGGAIAGFSDADFMVFLTPDCFADDAALPDDLVFAIQERIGPLPWSESGVGYPQAYFYDPARMPAWWTGPAPGAYRVLYGRLPDGIEATAERLRAGAESFLRGLHGFIAGDVRNFADSPDHQIPRRLRYIVTSVTPAIFCLATLRSADARGIWAKSKFEALEELAKAYPGEPGPGMAADLYARIAHIYGAPAFDVAAGREAFKLAVRFLRWAEAIAIEELTADATPAAPQS